MKKEVYLISLAILAFSVISLHSQTVKDIDGNVYKTVKIGNQIWMAENLKVTKLNDGTAIPLVIDDKAWGCLITPGYCWFHPESARTYEALYNWYTVNTGNLCPAGWHVPTNAEWTTLTDYLGGKDIAGGKLKEADTTHWNSPNTGATNETGFTALPGGMRDQDGIFSIAGDYGYWWSTTEINILDAYGWLMSYDGSFVGRIGNLTKLYGISVRCLKD